MRTEDDGTRGGTNAATRGMLIPLALTQFVASFAGSNMNVAMSSISKDLDTTIQGVQTAITLFLLCMAALMIPGSKLTDRLGRKRCLLLGLTIYGVGAVISALAPHLAVLILGYSGFEGVGSALMIPPIYILATMYFDDTASRARAFGAISGMGGIGAAAGPLIGGLITTAISWRASFLLQAAIVATIVVLARRLEDPLPPDSTRRFDVFGAVLSAVGMLFIVLGILQAGKHWTLTIAFLALGAALQLWFFIHIRSMERAHREPLLSVSLFRNRTSNLALVTQNVQWLLLMGTAFVITTFLQVEKHYSAIRTGVVFTAATAGILLSSVGAERFAKRRAQRTLIRAGFLIALVGIGLLLGLYKASPTVWRFAPGLFLFGFGVGAMLTPSVNVVQSSFSEDQQGEISGLSRAVSNLGSSLGTAIAGTILVADLGGGNRPYVVAMVFLAAIALVGLGAAMALPSGRRRATGERRSVVPQANGAP